MAVATVGFRSVRWRALTTFGGAFSSQYGCNRTFAARTRPGGGTALPQFGSEATRRPEFGIGGQGSSTGGIVDDIGRYMILHTVFNPDFEEAERLTFLSRLRFTYESQLNRTPKTLIILTTPDHAPIFTNKCAYAQTYIADVFACGNDEPITVLAAVVDDLFLPNFLPGTEDTPPGTRIGGFSCLFTDQRLSITSPPQVPRTSANDGTIEKPVGLTFSFPSDGTRRTVTLPLANTLFRTGQVCTVAKFDVTEQCAKVLNPADTTPKAYTVDFSVAPVALTSALPLRTLTPPRKVLSCKGNILREVESGDHDKKPAPASRELEEAVEKYFRITKPPQSKVDIFAYVTGKPDAQPNVDPWKLNGHGARLRKVLSGGGGWGAKAGLLSLDPQGRETGLEDEEEFGEAFERSFFGARAQEKEKGKWEGKGKGKEKGKMEGKGKGKEKGKGAFNTTPRNDNVVLQPGDYVQFFVADNSVLREGRQEAIEEGRYTEGNPLLEPEEVVPEGDAFHFGCVARETDSQEQQQPGQQKGTKGRGSGGGSKMSPADVSTIQRQKNRKMLLEQKRLLEVRKKFQLDVQGVFGGRSEDGVWLGKTGTTVSGGSWKMDVPGGDVRVIIDTEV